MGTYPKSSFNPFSLSTSNTMFPSFLTLKMSIMLLGSISLKSPLVRTKSLTILFHLLRHPISRTKHYGNVLMPWSFNGFTELSLRISCSLSSNPIPLLNRYGNAYVTSSKTTSIHEQCISNNSFQHSTRKLQNRLSLLPKTQDDLQPVSWCWLSGVQPTPRPPTCGRSHRCL